VKLTLTFDNGPDASTTPKVLDTLAERGLPATFFVVGEQIRRTGGRELAARAHAAGHAIGNHSMTHRIPLGEMGDPAAEVAEISDAEDLIGDLNEGRLFRPFGGGGRLGAHLLSPAAVTALSGGGYTVVLWNSLPHDWDDPQTWARRALDDLLVNEWTVVVLHDLPTGAMDLLPTFLDRVLDDGVEVVRDFPHDCVPIRAGVAQWDCSPLLTV
jgi:peptidoglycan/xylan/chitin deacetylase (PgdA/CDA1 family)